jgi:hypothetical protein
MNLIGVLLAQTTLPSPWDGFNTPWWTAILIAVPISVVANIITPNVQRWLATLSRSAARRRLKKLEGQILYIQKIKDDFPSFLSEMMYRGASALSWLASGLVQMLGVIQPPPQNKSHIFQLLNTITPLFAMLFLMVAWVMFIRMTKPLRWRTFADYVLKEKRAEVERLRSMLGTDLQPKAE